MTRNWGIPAKGLDLSRARNARPALTLLVSAAYGVIGVSLTFFSFTGARDMLDGLFRGPSIAAAVIAGSFGCWLYILLSWPRFAAQFTGGDGFSAVVLFYARATVALSAALLLAKVAAVVAGSTVSGLMLCAAGGAAAAAAFQTVLTFVPAGPPASPSSRD
ncbi:MAG: hypothetical protein AAF224_08445 [Pseudomonadota bacterium]